MVKLGKITYINAVPIYYGLDEKIANDNKITLITRPPSTLNKMLEEEKLDISPVSSVAYARNYKNWFLMQDFSISCFKEVLSVLLLSKYPIEKLDKKKIMLIDESETSVALIKLFLFEKNIKANFETKKITDCKKISNDVDAMLVIGDIALKEQWDKKQFKYSFDLGKMWQEKTNLPFVFAVWAIRKKFAKSYPNKILKVKKILEHSRKLGYEKIDNIINSANKKLNIEKKLCKKYYKCLDCTLGDEHIKSLKLFFKLLFEAKIITNNPTIKFCIETFE